MNVRNWIQILCILAAAGFYGCLSDQSYDKSTCREVSLASSTWPSDHGDSSRTKYTLNAGLPMSFQAEDIKIKKNTDLPKAQWIYTNGENSEFLYVMSGTMQFAWVAKVDAVTLEILQKVDIRNSLYIGGMLMHANGHVYAVHANTVYRFWNGDLLNSTTLDLPTRMNGKMAQSNGAVVTSDGYLVVRQWSLNMEDFVTMFGTAVPPLKNTIYALIIGGAVVSVMMMPRKSSSMASVLLTALLGALLGAMLSIAIILILLYRGYGGFDAAQFVFTNTFLLRNKGGGGEIKLIDPLTLEVKAELYMEERCSFARTALSVLPNGENAIVVLGDELVHQYRWNPDTEQLYEVTNWAERYRRRFVGTFPGTGPAIHNGIAYFTDNTFPVTLHGTSYTLFSKALDPDTAGAEAMQRVPLTVDGHSGFMFWSVVVSPFSGDVLPTTTATAAAAAIGEEIGDAVGEAATAATAAATAAAADVIIWDSANHNVQVRRATDLSLRYNISAMQGDCITVAADRGQMYMSDYNIGPKLNAAHEWFAGMGPTGKNTYPGLKKFLIVVDVKNGDILANVTVQEGGAIGASLIVPGANNDVFIGGSDGVMRVYV